MKQDSLEYILDISRRMAETQDLALLLNDIMDEAIRLVGAERGYVVLVQPDSVPGSEMDFRVRRGPSGQDLAEAEDQVSQSILRQVVEAGEPLVLRDAMQDPRFSEAESVIILGLRSIMCVPLISRGDTIGAIYVENRSIRGRFGQDDAIPLVLFANQAAVAIENAQLLQSLQESHDELEMRVQERTSELSEANVLLKQEITERVQAEDALRWERDRAQRYLDISGVIILALDAEGNITLVNRKGCEILECEKEEAIGRNWFDTFLPSWYKEDVKGVFEALLSGEVEGAEYIEGVVLTDSGRERTIRWYNSTLTDEAGNRIGTLSSGEDITERKRAEEALRVVEERFSKAFRSSPDSITITTLKDGRYLEVNDSFLEYTGFSRQEVIGHTALELNLWVDPRERDRLMRILWDQGMVRDLEVSMRSKSGAIGVLSMSAEIIELEGERCLLAVSRNITERKRMEEAIRQLYEQTRRDAETKTTLLREVNHRVRNNLTGIIGLIDTERRYASMEDRSAVQAAMERLVQRIVGLAQVHEMLSQSEWAPVPLSDLVARIVSSTLSALPLDRRVLVDVPSSSVRVSPRQASNLALVINELATNTIKYAASEGVTTRIAVHMACEKEDTVLLEYRDDGPGYPADVLCLERHGVGLYLVQNLVRHPLHGSLTLANDGGAVTIIRFAVDEERTT